MGYELIVCLPLIVQKGCRSSCLNGAHFWRFDFFHYFIWYPPFLGILCWYFTLWNSCCSNRLLLCCCWGLRPSKPLTCEESGPAQLVLQYTPCWMEASFCLLRIIVAASPWSHLLEQCGSDVPHSCTVQYVLPGLVLCYVLKVYFFCMAPGPIVTILLLCCTWLPDADRTRRQTRRQDGFVCINFQQSISQDKCSRRYGCKCHILWIG